MAVNFGLTATPEQVVGDNLRTRRKELGLTQDRAGQLIGGPLGRDWSRQTMSIAEGGGRAFTAAELIAMAQALETSVDYFFRLPLGVMRVELPAGTVARAQVALAPDGPATRGDDPGRWLVLLREYLAGLEGDLQERGTVTAGVAEAIDRMWAFEKEKREAGERVLRLAWTALERYEAEIGATSGQDNNDDQEENRGE